MSVTDITDHFAQYACRLVEITGGEPLCQKGTPALVKRLLDNGYTVLMETNGSFDIGLVDSRCIKIMDMKCPGSGESEKNDMENLNRLGENDQVKFVISDRIDYEFAKKLIYHTWTPPFPFPVLFSATSGLLDPAVLAKWILSDNLDVRLQIQLHKILWPNEDKGR